MDFDGNGNAVRIQNVPTMNIYSTKIETGFVQIRSNRQCHEMRTHRVHILTIFSLFVYRLFRWKIVCKMQ